MLKTSVLPTLFLSLLGGAFFLSGCLPTAQPSSTQDTAPTTDSATEKSGTTTVRGTLQIQGKTALLKTATGNVAVESYDVELAPYNGKAVTVTGKYSGDTLFASSISE